MGVALQNAQYLAEETKAYGGLYTQWGIAVISPSPGIGMLLHFSAKLGSFFQISLCLRHYVSLVGGRSPSLSSHQAQAECVWGLGSCDLRDSSWVQVFALDGAGRVRSIAYTSSIGSNCLGSEDGFTVVGWKQGCR